MSHLTRDSFPYNVPIPSKDGCYTLFLQSLPTDCSEKKLRECFEPYGDLVRIEMPFERQSGGCQGFALIAYREEESAKNAMRDMDGATLYDSEISISWAFAESSVKTE